MEELNQHIRQLGEFGEAKLAKIFYSFEEKDNGVIFMTMDKIQTAPFDLRTLEGVFETLEKSVQERIWEEFKTNSRMAMERLILTHVAKSRGYTPKIRYDKMENNLKAVFLPQTDGEVYVQWCG